MHDDLHTAFPDTTVPDLLDAIPGGTRVLGRVTADHAVAGSYAMQITSRSAGGSASIRQSGDFSAAAGRPETIAETELTGTPANQRVDLSITVAGRRVSTSHSTRACLTRSAKLPA